MSAAPGLPRRALAGVLGLAAAAPAAAVALPMPPGATDRLWRCLRLLEQAEATFPGEDDPAGQRAAIAGINAILGAAAVIRPDTAEAFAVKARIVQLHADDGAPGAMVARFLLHDLMACGGEYWT